MTTKNESLVKDVVGKISMRGMTFEYVPSLVFDYGQIIITARVVDTDDESRIITQTTLTRIPNSHPIKENGAIQHIRERVHGMYLHEADELLKFNGVAIFNPHK